jgi:hypothetical protein
VPDEERLGDGALSRGEDAAPAGLLQRTNLFAQQAAGEVGHD